MTTGYEKILDLMHRKNKISDSRFQRFHDGLISCYNLEKCETSPETPEVSPKVSAAAPPIPSSLIPEDPAWTTNAVERAVTGKLTEPVAISVKPAFQQILGEGPVWFCPDQATAASKSPDLALTGEELAVVIQLLHGDQQLAAAAIMGKRILGGTIIDYSDSSSSLDPEAAQPSDDQVVLSSQEEGKDAGGAGDGATGHQESGVSQLTPEGLPSPGRHLVKIRTVKAYLHNFPEYTGPRARMEMEVSHGPDSGKILVDNISLPHEKESKGMLLRRLRIAKRLGLITRGPKGEIIQQGSWKVLEGVVCWVDVAYKTFGGRKVLTVDNYELQ